MNTSLQSWLDIPSTHDFSIHNIPFGIFYTQKNTSRARVGAALGDHVIDLLALQKLGYFDDVSGLDSACFEQISLNHFLSLGNKNCNLVREKIQGLFDQKNEVLKKNSAHVEKILVPQRDVNMLLPIAVADYVDFYSNIQHATNVGKLFRDPQNPLLPNWKHIPIGYHGRSSSIVVSGTNFKRPYGQLTSNDSVSPLFAPSRQMDFELEMAFVTNKESEMGQRISPDQASEHIFGLTLFNDWSARDIQRWEYVPLGPFLGKSFASSMSPWVVSLEALAPFVLHAPEKDVPELDYLKCNSPANYDIHLDVYLQSAKMQEPVRISSSNYKHLYWNLFQQLAHMTSNGTPVRIGDVYASGTISGDSEDSYGSMLELCFAGKKPLLLPDGSSRIFLQDGDTVIFKGYAQKDHIRVGFGEVRGTVLSSG